MDSDEVDLNGEGRPKTCRENQKCLADLSEPLTNQVTRIKEMLFHANIN